MRIPRLHLISDRRICPLNQLPAVALAAAGAGVDAIHVRERDLSDETLLRTVESVMSAVAGTGCLVLVNNRIDIAIQAGADGVHLPEGGADVDEARSALPAGSLIGRSVHSKESALRAESEGVDYVIAGHVFETGSKPGQPGRGLEFLQEVVGNVDIPVIAIGGITTENVASVLETGAHGVAVLSAILAADDPATVAAQFRNAMDESKVRGI